MNGMKLMLNPDMFKKVGDGALYVLAPKFGEEVPDVIQNSSLGEGYTVLSPMACHSFFPQHPIIRDMLNERYFPPIDQSDIAGQKVIILRDAIKHNDSLFDIAVRDSLKTGSLEGDIVKITRECIEPNGGKTVGFIRMVHPDYEKENPLCGQFAARQYSSEKLEGEIPVLDFLESLD